MPDLTKSMSVLNLAQQRSVRLFKACVLDERSLAQVAGTEGVTRERVRQIVQSQCRKMMHPTVLGKRRLKEPPAGMRPHGIDHMRIEKKQWEDLLQKWIAMQPPDVPT